MRNTFTKAAMLSTLLFLTALFFSFSTVNAEENTGTSTQHMNQGNPGDHHDEPPIDPRSGQPFTRADEVKYQKYADECEATKGLLSEGSTQELVAEGFTRIQVEKLCKDGPDHHDGPSGGQDGQPRP